MKPAESWRGICLIEKKRAGRRVAPRGLEPTPRSTRTVTHGDDRIVYQGNTHLIVHVRHRLALATSAALDQAKRDRDEMSLKSRSYEMLMGEMAVIARGQRQELARLYRANRRLREHLPDTPEQVGHKQRNQRARRTQRERFADAVIWGPRSW